MLRIVALIACWSHDYWHDVNKGDCDDEGPSRHTFLHLGTTTDLPDGEGMIERIQTMRSLILDEYDGHAELHSFAVIDEKQWTAFRAKAVWPVPIDIDAEGTTDKPIIVNDLLSLDEALVIWGGSGTIIVPGDRYELPENAPALQLRPDSTTAGPEFAQRL